MKLPTVLIEDPDNEFGEKLIDEADFDSKKHTKVGAKKKAAKKKTKKKAAK